MNTTTSALAVLPLVLAFNAHADIVNVSQNRRVSASASFVSPITHSNTGVGTWTDSVSQQSGIYRSGGSASQASTVSVSRLRAVGSATANDDIQVTYGQASSAFDVTFDVASSTGFLLHGSWRTQHDFSSTSPAAELIFQRLSPAPMVFHRSYFFDDTIRGGGFAVSGNVVLDGTLPAGRYNLSVFVDLTVSRTPGVFGPYTASFDVDMVVPTPMSSLLLALAPLHRRRRVPGR